jgi:hypothetical protein
VNLIEKSTSFGAQSAMGTVMDTLESYLDSDYLAQKQDIADIDRMLIDVARTFSKTFKDGKWPYEYRIEPPAKAHPKPLQNPSASGSPQPAVGVSPADKSTIEKSQGTLAMVLTTTGRLLGNCKLPKETYADFPIGDELRAKLKGNWTTGLDTLRGYLTPGRVVSSSFGDDNPITLSHLSELSYLLKPEFVAKKNEIDSSLKTAIAALEKLLSKDPATTEMLTPGGPNRYYRNAFVPLRSLRAAIVLLDTKTAKGSPKYRVFFESTLHDQLSFSSIPDSRFDPAELIYCIEGLLLCAPESVDTSLFDRVLEVLAQAQNTSACWRPNKPFIASSTGAIMLPISVEGANSLMRSAAMMDKNRQYDTFTAKTLPLIQRFWHWLQASSVRFDECLGWHSEHVNAADLIHIWDTSQVTEFMIAFREMLERHIAAESLRLSRLSVRLAKPAKGKWPDITNEFEPLADDPVAKNVPAAEKAPVAEDVPAPEKVYEKLGTDFATPWKSGDRPANYSMLLYGPPGTGKSTVAENLADFLGFPVITVTVSDFLGGGGANVEARAKAIFQTLEAQERCIILFDEIDSFLLDRDSQLYRDQDSLFQFLTPGMLTKINDLRKRKRSIFIIATNYADRIDAAIMRTGRIDKKYLLRLPNAARRIEILKRKEFKVQIKKRKTLKKNTAFFAFPDLKGATDDAKRVAAVKAGPNATPDPPTQDAVEASLRHRAPATSLKSYLARLKQDERFPAEEFMGLAQLAIEADRLGEVAKAIEGLKPEERTKFNESLDEKQAVQVLTWTKA